VGSIPTFGIKKPLQYWRGFSFLTQVCIYRIS